MTDAKTRPVSVLGLGLMGSALAEALLAAGHAVTVWNRTPAKTAPLVAKGARAAGSAAEAIVAGEVALVCVTNCAAAIEILDAVPAGGPAAPVVLLSAMGEDDAPGLARATARIGADCLAGSILGVPDNVRAGTATILASGPRAVFEACAEVLGRFGGASHLGADLGAAGSFDKVFFAYAYGLHAAFFQAAAMAHAKGLALEALFDTVQARTPVMLGQLQALGGKIAARDHTATMGALTVWAEPFEATLAMCRALGIGDAVPAAIMANFRRAMAAGRGDQDLSAIFETLVEGARR